MLFGSYGAQPLLRPDLKCPTTLMTMTTTGRTKYTNEDPRQITMNFLANYTQAEGLAEDIAYSYLRSVPLAVVEPLLARRPWGSEQIRRMLQAVIAREGEIFRSVPSDYDLVAEWGWATKVRNDLAHSAGQWIDRSGARGPRPSPEADAKYPDLWELIPRSQRHPMRVLMKPLTVGELFEHFLRIGGVLTALTDIAAHLGILSLNGYMGPGPKPLPTLGA